MLSLEKPSNSWIEQIESFKKAIQGSRYQGCSNLGDFENIEEWMDSLEHTYILSLDGILIGMIEIREITSDYLLNYGGNIGYTIHPDYRGRGYGKKILALALPICKEIGLSKVLVTCVDFNKKSESIIRHNGGILEDIRREEDAGVNLMRFYINL